MDWSVACCVLCSAAPVSLGILALFLPRSSTASEQSFPLLWDTMALLLLGIFVADIVFSALLLLCAACASADKYTSNKVSVMSV
jgi:hypothetical protein